MSNAIQFLETLGREQVFANMPTEAYAKLIASLDIDSEQRQALQDRNASALKGLLCARDTMLCMVATPDGGETQDQPDKSDDDDGGGDDRKEDAPERIDHPA